MIIFKVQVPKEIFLLYNLYLFFLFHLSFWHAITHMLIFCPCHTIHRAGYSPYVPQIYSPSFSTLFYALGVWLYNWFSCPSTFQLSLAHGTCCRRIGGQKKLTYICSAPSLLGQGWDVPESFYFRHNFCRPCFTAFSRVHYLPFPHTFWLGVVYRPYYS